MNKVRKYYWYIGLPILALIAGTVMFFDLIARTVQGNPHPQINYFIFVMIGFGTVLIWVHVMRMNRDARFIQKFYELARAQPDPQTLRELVARAPADTASVFEIVTDLIGRPVSAVQHAALGAELQRFKSNQARHLILPQFLGGMMVGLGLLGTFIGLLAALAEIAKLISAFSITGSGDAVAAISMLVERLTAPMQAMGVAFSASLFGVLGSLIMGAFLVGLRNASGELISMMESRVAYLTDFGGSAQTDDAAALSDAVASLAEQSPILRSLGTALDQSERRVRTLVTSLVQLTARMDRSEHNTNQLLAAVQESKAREAEMLSTARETHSTLTEIAARWAGAQQLEGRIVTLLEEQQARMEQLVDTASQLSKAQQGVNARLVEAVGAAQAEQARTVQQINSVSVVLEELGESMRAGLQDVAGVQRRSADQLAEALHNGLKDLAGVQRRESDQALALLQSGLKDLAGAQRRTAEDLLYEQSQLLGRLSEAIAAGKGEQVAMTLAITRVSDALGAVSEHSHQGLRAVIEAHERTLAGIGRQQLEVSSKLAATVERAQSGQGEVLHGVSAAVDRIAGELREAGRANGALVNRLELLLEEMQVRQDQLTETLMRSAETA